MTKKNSKEHKRQRVGILSVVSELHTSGMMYIAEQIIEGLKKKKYSTPLVHGSEISSPSTLLKTYYSQFWHFWHSATEFKNVESTQAVFLHTSFPALIFCIHPKFRRVPKIYFYHGSDWEDWLSQIVPPKRHLILGWIKRMFFSGSRIFLTFIIERLVFILATRVIAYSDTAYQKMIKNNVSLKKLRKITLGVDESIFFPIKKQIKTKKMKLLCVSRFEPRKEILFLVRSFHTLIHTDQNAEYSLVLATPLTTQYASYHKQVVAEIDTLGLKKYVQILVNKEQKELAPYYRKSDLFILPSKQETFGLAALESLASGVPATCFSKNAATSQLISKVDKRFIFSEFSTNAVVKKILAIKKMIEKNNSLQKRCLRVAHEYSWDKTIERCIIIATEDG